MRIRKPPVFRAWAALSTLCAITGCLSPHLTESLAVMPRDVSLQGDALIASPPLPSAPRLGRAPIAVLGPGRRGDELGLEDVRIDDFVTNFQRRRLSFQDALDRSGTYWPELVAILDAEGVPIELAYVPLIESGYRTAASRRRARSACGNSPLRPRGAMGCASMRTSTSGAIPSHPLARPPIIYGISMRCLGAGSSRWRIQHRPGTGRPRAARAGGTSGPGRLWREPVAAPGARLRRSSLSPPCGSRGRRSSTDSPRHNPSRSPMRWSWCATACPCAPLRSWPAYRRRTWRR